MNIGRELKHRKWSASTGTVQTSSLLITPEILLVTIAACLRLDDRTSLASTCRQLRAGEHSNQYYIASRDARLRQLIGGIRLWLNVAPGNDEDINTLNDDENNLFRATMRELNGAGRWGLPGLVELASVINVEPAHCLDTYDGIEMRRESYGRKGLRERCARRFCDTVKSLQWRLSDIDKCELARQTARILEASGTHCLDLQIARTYITDPNDAIIDTCSREREAIYVLGILGRSALPYLKIIFGKLLPPPFDSHDNPYDEDFEDFNWDDFLIDLECSASHGVNEEGWVPSTSTSIALIAMKKLRPFFTHLEMQIVLDFLGKNMNSFQAQDNECYQDAYDEWEGSYQTLIELHWIYFQRGNNVVNTRDEINNYHSTKVFENTN